MGDDFIVRVKQIAQYPPPPNNAVFPEDIVLIQRGLGGPFYAPALLDCIVDTLNNTTAPIGVGLFPPETAVPSSVFTQWLTSIQGGGLLWNAYATPQGLQTWMSGTSAQLRWDGAGWSFVSGASPATWAPAAQITPQGHMYLCDTLTVNRAPTGDNEVATYDWVCSGFNELKTTIEGELATTQSNVNSQVATITSTLQGQITGNFSTLTGSINSVNSTLSSQINGVNSDLSQQIQHVNNNLGAAISSNFSTLQGLITSGDNALSGQIGSVNTTLQGQINGVNTNLSNQILNIDATVTGRLNSMQGQIHALPTSFFVISTVNAAIQNWLRANPSVTSFNDRTGAVTLSMRDIIEAGGVSQLCPTIVSPRFCGRPTAPTPCWDEISPVIPNTHWVMCKIWEDAHRQWCRIAETFAPLHSPNFTGMPTAPTPEPGSNDAKLATTAFVQAAIIQNTVGVASFNTRTGAVTLTTQDIVDAQGAPILSPHFTGNPECNTPAVGTYSHIMPDTIWVTDLVNARWANVVSSWNGRHGDVLLRWDDVAAVGGAPLRDPHFQGAPLTTTPPSADNSTRIADTAWVRGNVGELKTYVDSELDHIRDHSVWSFNQRRGHVVFSPNDLSAVGGAFLHSPHFTGEPRAPTPPPDDDSTRLATTAYVDSAIASNPGPPGAPGMPGAQGEPGAPGHGLQILGTVPTFAALPSTGNQVGDIWFVAANSTYYWWTGDQWAVLNQIQGGPYLPISGGTLTGPLTLDVLHVAHITSAPIIGPLAPDVGPALLFWNKSGSGYNNLLHAMSGGVYRWMVDFGDAAPETGANAGSNYVIYRFSDAGVSLGAAFSIQRSDGAVSIPLMNSDLHVKKITPALQLEKLAPGQSCMIDGQINGLMRWRVHLGDGALESGSDAGSNFAVASYNDAGTFTRTVLSFNRASGLGSVAADPVVALGIATKQYVDAAANVSRFLALTGGTLTGQFTIAPASGASQIILRKPVSGQQSGVLGQLGTATRWGVFLGNSTAETGSDTGSNFTIVRYSDAGTNTGTPFTITRSTGALVISAATANHTVASPIALTTSGNTGASFNILNNGTGASFSVFTGGTNHFTLNPAGTVTMSAAMIASFKSVLGIA